MSPIEFGDTDFVWDDTRAQEFGQWLLTIAIGLLHEDKGRPVFLFEHP
jgi:hypothetical protein